MGDLLKTHKNAKTECPCCGTKIKECPFCGSAGVILHYENSVFCNKCDALMDFGYWCGTENGVPVIHHVIQAWNTRETNHNKG